MSHVMSAVIVVDYAPQEVRPLLTEPQSFGRHDVVHMQAFGRLDDHAAGGGKYLQSDVYAAGLNHVSPEAVEAWFLGLPWGKVGSAVLVYDVESEYRRIIPTPGWKEEDVL